MTAPLSPADFARAAGVSRETLDRLEAYRSHLAIWQKKRNLVSASTLVDPWRRHFLDSAQLFPQILESTQTVIDLGSGAGFPGMVLAIMGLKDVHLVETDSHKVAFLRHVAGVTQTPVTIHPVDIVSLQALKADVVCSRALAPLAKLLGYALVLLKKDGYCLFLKGQTVDSEVEQARRDWHFVDERYPSMSDPSGCLLRLSALRSR